MVRLSHIRKSFNGKNVLRDISMNVDDHEFVIMLGSSGAGKSTLLRCMNGLCVPEEGKIEIDETDVTKKNLSKVRKKVGFIFQGSNVVGNVPVLNNVLMGSLCRKGSFHIGFSKNDKEKALELLEMVGLENFAQERTDRLSGGQKQRVGIARALLQQPQVLLADEPVSSLDPVTGHEILSLLKDINSKLGTSVICNLHQLDYAREFGDRIIGLKQGMLAFDAPGGSVSEQELMELYYNEKETK